MVVSQNNPPPYQNNGPQAGGVQSDFYKSQFFVRHGTNAVSEEFLRDVREIRVEESLYQPCHFTIVVDNPYGPGEEKGEPGLYTDKFKPGENWEIGFRTSKADYEPFRTDFQGRVYAGKAFKVSSNFDKQSQGRITISGYDELALLAEGTRNRTFTNISHKEIVEKIAKDVGIGTKLGSIEDNGVVEEYICQAGETNLQFLGKLAASCGFEFFVQCEIDKYGDPQGYLYFRKPKPFPDAKDAPLKLKWGENIRSIKPCYKKFQVNKVDVPFWNYKRKTIDGVVVPRNSGKGVSTAGLEPPNTTVTGATTICSGGWNVNNITKAKKLAQSLCDQYEGQALCAEIEVEGNADVRPGHHITIISDKAKADLKSFTGNYYVTDTAHIYEQGRFKTKITVSETGGYDVFEHPYSPIEHLIPGQTRLVGIVTNNKDADSPPNMGCVKVRFPTLRSEASPQGIESHWARVITTGAGNNRGIDWLPEIGDEVVVDFEHGDIHRPYIVGSVWNGVDHSPEDHNHRVNANGVRLRTLKTRVGHEIEFVEEDGNDGKQRGIYVKTADRLKIDMNDTKKEIRISTPGGMEIIMNDKTASIFIHAGGGGKILLNGSGVHIN